MKRILKIIFSNPLTYFMILFFIILLIVSAQPGNNSAQNQNQGPILFTPTPTAEPRIGIPTPYPEEMLAKSAEQTNGIVFMGIILVLIVVWGTLSVMSPKNR
jgi:hypothetical protein